MRVLLTNDDGFDAPGIRALFEAVRQLPEVTAIDIIAPWEAQSGKSHAISASFGCREVEVDGIGPVAAVDGTPGDCVRAIFALPDHPRPDWVLSGINRGGNLGVDVYYSGTVAAAREAAIHGIPAIALSQYVKPDLPENWARSRDWAAAVLKALLSTVELLAGENESSPGRGSNPGQQVPPPAAEASLADMTRRALADHDLQLPPIPCWNVNFPCVPPGHHPHGVQVVRHSTDPLLTEYAADLEDEDRPLYQYAGSYQDRPRSPGTDVHVVFEGNISISPLRL